MATINFNWGSAPPELEVEGVWADGVTFRTVAGLCENPSLDIVFKPENVEAMRLDSSALAIVIPWTVIIDDSLAVGKATSLIARVDIDASEVGVDGLKVTKKAAGELLDIWLESYDVDNIGVHLNLCKSSSDSVLAETDDLELLGGIGFHGVGTNESEWAPGAWILSTQVGATSATNTVPGLLELGTYQADGTANDYQICLYPDGLVGVGVKAPSAKLEVRDADTPQIKIVPLDAYDAAVADYAQFEVQSDGQLDIVTHDDSASAAHICLMPDGYVGIGTLAPNSAVEIALSTENLEIVNAGSAAATEQDWIEVKVGNNTGYVRVFSAK